MARATDKSKEPDRDVFTRILQKGVNDGMIPGGTREARTWYRNKALHIANVNREEVVHADATRFRTEVVPGRMYMFFYDPKTKAKMPYYDRMPLIFPISVLDTSFLGLNLHYLPFT